MIGAGALLFVPMSSGKEWLRWVLALVPLWVLLAASACLEAGSGNGGTPAGEDVVVLLRTPTPLPSPTPTPEPSPTPTPTPVNVCSANPDPAPPSVLQVLEPQPGQEVRNPFPIRGWGSNIGYRNMGVAVAVLGADGTVLQAPLNLPPQPRDFRILPSGMQNTEYTRPFAADILLTDLTGPTPVCIWVYIETTEEGVPQQVVQVPVVVRP